MRGDRPAMAEWILDLAVAVTPEHVADRHNGLGAEPDRARGDAFDVFDIEVDGDRRSPERFRSKRAVFGHFIDQHERGIADADAGMHQPSVRAGQARGFGRVESLLVELDRLGCAGTHQMWRDCVHAVWNCADIAHTYSLLGCCCGWPRRVTR